MTVKSAMLKIALHVDLTALHMKGDGAPDDFFKALGCYLNDVRNGHAYAQVSVGNLFLDGRGVPQDTPLAIKWYLRAASLGNASAKAKIELLKLYVEKNTKTCLLLPTLTNLNEQVDCNHFRHIV